MSIVLILGFLVFIAIAIAGVYYYKYSNLQSSYESLRQKMNDVRADADRSDYYDDANYVAFLGAIADLKLHITEIERELLFIQNKLGIESPYPTSTPRPQHGAVEENQKARSEPRKPARVVSDQDLIRVYNDVVGGNLDRQKFDNLYEPVMLRVTNAAERRNDSAVAPVFEAGAPGQGEYMAVNTGDGAGNAYFVVPKFHLTVTYGIFADGAIGAVFECTNFDPGQDPKEFRLRRPARFVKHSDGQWSLQDKGEIRF
jgi:hypothetical protein